VQHSNAYIIAFSAAVCVVCALFVAGSAVSLKERQQLNVRLDRQKNVLAVAGLMGEGEKLGAAEIARRFEESIRPQVIDVETGKPDPDIDPASFNQRAAAKDDATSHAVPENPSKIMRVANDALVYQVLRDGKVDAVIIPIRGYGLWSVLYGYLALADDGVTIKGITYYQHGETPGLGGEVDNPRWKKKWIGRKAYDERGNPAISVKKGPAGPVDEDPYHVDGLSGATLTSNGVTHMMRFWLGKNGFGPYLESIREQKGS
jgi:Na+-transporting NADH:ubiquinone oxidoreductase subunit C